MLSLLTKIRTEKTDKLRKREILPAVLYGPKIKPRTIEIDLKKFKKIYEKAGESSLINLKVEDDKKEYSVLIHNVQRDPLKGEFIHIDFYQPILTEEVEATVPLIFEGEAPAVKELKGTLVKEIQEIEVKALPKDLPHEIKVNVDNLNTFEDEILVKNLKISDKVQILKEREEIIAKVIPPTKVEEELEKPIEEEAAEETTEAETVEEKKDEEQVGDGEREEKTKEK